MTDFKTIKTGDIVRVVGVGVPGFAKHNGLIKSVIHNVKWHGDIRWCETVVRSKHGRIVCSGSQALYGHLWSKK